ncbi:MAG: hypothetical protein ABJL55_18065 [Roseibium sp.]
MKKTVLALCAAALLAVCLPASHALAGPKKPTIVTSKSMAQAKTKAKTKAKAMFTQRTVAFRMTENTKTRMLMSKTLPANINDNNVLKNRTKGKPVMQVELVFASENGKTRITGDTWMLLDPKVKNKDKFNLLQTPDGKRLKKLLNQIR